MLEHTVKKVDDKNCQDMIVRFKIGFGNDVSNCVDHRDNSCPASWDIKVNISTLYVGG